MDNALKLYLKSTGLLTFSAPLNYAKSVRNNILNPRIFPQIKKNRLRNFYWAYLAGRRGTVTLSITQPSERAVLWRGQRPRPQ